MIRKLYRFLLWLHPPAFRQEFAEEMLWIFDEARKSEGVFALFLDGLVSLGRQWLLRSGSWKVAAAVAGGLLQVTAGAMAMLVFGRAQIAARLGAVQPSMSITMTSFIRITLWLFAGILLMVILLVLWVKNFTRRRMHQISVSARPGWQGLSGGPRCSNSAASRNATPVFPP